MSAIPALRGEDYRLEAKITASPGAALATRRLMLFFAAGKAEHHGGLDCSPPPTKEEHCRFFDR